MKKSWHGLVLLGLLTAAPAAAQESTETIVVTASRSEQARFEVDRSVDVLGRDELAPAGVESTPEALEEFAGVHLQQTNRGSGTPFIRGLVGPQNLILIDGVRFNTSTFRTGPNQYLALVDPLALQRVEVLRGPSSVLFGNGAMGGVIGLFTAEPQPNGAGFGIGGRSGIRFSSADRSTGFHLQLEPALAEQALWLGAHFDNFDTLRAGDGRQQPLSNYRTGFWQAKVRHRGDGWTLTGAYLGAMLRDTGRTDAAGSGDLRFYDNDDHLAYLAFRYRSAGLLRGVQATASYHRQEERTLRFSCQRSEAGTVADLGACFGLEGETLTRKRFYDDAVDVLGADLHAELAPWAGRLRLQGGAEFYQEWVGSGLESATADDFVFQPQPRGNYSDGSRYRSAGAYLHAGAVLWDFGDVVGRLQATAGARFSHFAASAPDVPEFGTVAYSHDGVVGAAGLQWLCPGAYNLYATFAQGFRAPNLQETTQMGDTGTKFNIPNPDLRPEKSNTFEVGARLNLGPAELSAAAFLALGTDAITWEPASYQGQTEIDGKPVTRLANAQRGRTVGFESRLTLRAGRLRLDVDATWIRGDLIAADDSEMPARWIPPFFGRVGLWYDHPGDRIYAGIYVRWSDRQDRLNPQDLLDPRICETAPFSGLLQDPCAGTHGWATVDLRAGWRVDERIALRLVLANLTDVHYRAYGSGIDAPGFDARLSLDLVF